MKRQTIVEISWFVLLVVAGTLLRIWLESWPNVAPVAAIALFCGYLFRSRLAAACVPLAIMTASDLVIGGHDARMMAVVYAMLAAPVLMSGWLRRGLRADRAAWQAAGRAGLTLVSASLTASVLFFLTTNLASWLWFPMYEANWFGLTRCYVQALPFFRATLAGDLFFAVVLFGGYGLACHFGWAGSRAKVAAGAKA